MINNPMINNPFNINIKGKLVKEDFSRYAQAARDRQTGEIQYSIPFDIESIGMRNTFLYKILLTYVKTIFDEDDMLLDMRIAEDELITMGLTVFENSPNYNRYVLGAGYINHPVPQLEIDVLLDDEEKQLVDGYVQEIKKKLDWNNVSAQAYSSSAFLENPEEALGEILKSSFNA